MLGNSSAVGLMIAHPIYPPGNDRWKYHLKWYITAPWASFVTIFHRCRWGSHTSGPINLCGWKLGIQHGWIMLYFFPPCPPSCGELNPFHTDYDARAIVWPILWCLAHHGPDASKFAKASAWGRLLLACTTTVISSHKSVGVKKYSKDVNCFKIK